MNVFEFLEGGGLLVLCVLIVVFAITRSRAAHESWPKGVLATNALVLAIVASGFFGILTFIDSFVAS